MLKNGKLFGKKILSKNEITSINPNYEEFKKLQQLNDSKKSNSIIDNIYGNNTGLDASDFSAAAQFEFTNDKFDVKHIKLDKYRSMASFPEIGEIIDEYVNSILNENDEGEFCYLKFDKSFEDSDKNGNKRERLKNEFKKLISYFNFDNNGDNIFRKFIVDGEITFENIIDPAKKSNGIIGVRHIPTEIYDYIFNENRNRVGILLNANLVNNANIQDNKFTLSERTDGKKIKGFNSNIDNSLEYIKFSDKKKIIPMPLNQLTHITSGLTNSDESVNYSIIERAKRPFNQLRLTEDAITIYRIVRAPMRYLFKIYTGSMPWHKARHMIERVKDKYSNKKYYDPVTGTISSNFDVHSITESFWFAKGACGEGSDVETIGGDQSLWSDFPDLEYYLKKLYRIMKVPTNLVTERTSTIYKAKEEVTFEEYRFAKEIIKIQNRIALALFETFKTHLQLLGLWESMKLTDSKVNVKFVKPILYDLYFSQRILNIKYENYETIAGKEEISNSWAQKNVLNWTQKQIDENRQELSKDKLWEAALEKQVSNYSDNNTPIPKYPSASDDSDGESKW